MTNTRKIKLILITLLVGLIIFLVSNESRPGSIFYAVDKNIEKAEIAVAKSQGKITEASKYLELAEERIDEIEAIVGSNASFRLIPVVNAQSKGLVESLSNKKLDRIEKLIVEYSDLLDQAIDTLRKAKEEGKETNEILENFANITLRHQERLSDIYDKMPNGNAKEAILTAMERSRDGHNRSAASITGERRENYRKEVLERREEINEKIKNARKGMEASETDEEE